jgi:hypothetical protein
MHDTSQRYVEDDVAPLEVQVEHLKEVIVLLQAKLADMREEKDRWQSRAERISLVAPY